MNQEGQKEIRKEERKGGYFVVRIRGRGPT
jgi:hypothetical protein